MAVPHLLETLVTRFRHRRRWYDDIDDVELLLFVTSPVYRYVTAAMAVVAGVLAVAVTVTGLHILQR